MFKIVLLALVASLGLRVEFGYAGYYAHGVMRDVVRVRQAGWTANPLPADLPPVIGFIATDDPDDIGKLAALWHKSEGWAGPYLIADVCNQVEGHCKRMKRLGLVADVDWNTAARWGVIGHGGTGEVAILIGVAIWEK